jgi:hypothetical protein
MITIDERPFMSNREKYPAFFKVARGLRSAVKVLTGESGDPDSLADSVLEYVPLEKANVISSSSGTSGLWHMPVLDIDHECLLIDSTTPGHHHLIIRKCLSWPDYERLLKVLAEVGILEHGYVGVSINRKSTWIRVPWARKGDPLPEGYAVPDWAPENDEPPL